MHGIEVLNHFAFGIVEVRQHVFGGKHIFPALPAHRIERNVATDKDKPCSRISRRTIAGPCLQRSEARLLKRLLGHVEVAKVPQQCRHRLRSGSRQNSVDVRNVHYVVPDPDWKKAIGRIS